MNSEGLKTVSQVKKSVARVIFLPDQRRLEERILERRIHELQELPLLTEWEKLELEELIKRKWALA